MPKISDNKYFQSLADELDSKFGRINALIGNHSAEKGSYHEYLIKDFLTQHLSKQYSVKTGFIYVDDLHISPQIDLMIIDESQTPGILAQYDDFVIVYPEAVCCVIEIKTRINKREFLRATELIHRIKELSIYNNNSGQVIGGVIFSFDGETFTPQRLDNWYKSKAECDLSRYPDGILSLKQGLIMKWNLQNDHRGHYFVIGDDEIKWKSLSIFLAILIKFCELRSGINRQDDKNPFERYSRIENLLVSNEYLKYGSGLQKVK